MKCERCSCFAECEGLGRELCVCSDYDESDEARRDDREAYEIDKADAKRKCYD